jgi:hypothetical protein
MLTRLALLASFVVFAISVAETFGEPIWAPGLYMLDLLAVGLLLAAWIGNRRRRVPADHG